MTHLTLEEMRGKGGLIEIRENLRKHIEDAKRNGWDETAIILSQAEVLVASRIFKTKDMDSEEWDDDRPTEYIDNIQELYDAAK